MDSTIREIMSENIDGPVVIRRRRKIIRPSRDKTPEPTVKSGGVKTKYSDDESSSTAEQNAGSNSRPRMISVSTGPGISVHRSKILSRRDKGIGTSAVRSQSTPRVESNQQNVEISARPAKHRSLSSPRYNFFFFSFEL